MRRFARMWPEWEKVPSVMAQITWTAHRLLLDRFSEDSNLYAWYAAKSVANRWSARLLHAIDAIQRYTAEGREAFFADSKTQDTVIRNIEILGQAIKGISDDTRALEPEVPGERSPACATC
jgi:hypothetical protein